VFMMPTNVLVQLFRCSKIDMMHVLDTNISQLDIVVWWVVVISSDIALASAVRHTNIPKKLTNTTIVSNISLKYLPKVWCGIIIFAFIFFYYTKEKYFLQLFSFRIASFLPRKLSEQPKYLYSSSTLGSATHKLSLHFGTAPQRQSITIPSGSL